MEQHGFHPYTLEIAGLVRDGYMTREEGLNKLSVPPDPEVIEYVRKRLGITKTRKIENTKGKNAKRKG